MKFTENYSSCTTNRETFSKVDKAFLSTKHDTRLLRQMSSINIDFSDDEDSDENLSNFTPTDLKASAKSLASMASLLEEEIKTSDKIAAARKDRSLRAAFWNLGVNMNSLSDSELVAILDGMEKVQGDEGPGDESLGNVTPMKMKASWKASTTPRVSTASIFEEDTMSSDKIDAARKDLELRDAFRGLGVDIDSLDDGQLKAILDEMESNVDEGDATKDLVAGLPEKKVNERVNAARKDLELRNAFRGLGVDIDSLDDGQLEAILDDMESNVDEGDATKDLVTGVPEKKVNEKVDAARKDPELRDAFRGLGVDIDSLDDGKLEAILDDMESNEGEGDVAKDLVADVSKTKRNERADAARKDPELRDAFRGLGVDIDSLDDGKLEAILHDMENNVDKADVTSIMKNAEADLPPKKISERADAARKNPELRKAFIGLGVDMDTLDDDKLGAILDGMDDEEGEVATRKNVTEEEKKRDSEYGSFLSLYEEEEIHEATRMNVTEEKKKRDSGYDEFLAFLRS